MNSEWLQFGAVGTAEITSSMMEESEEGVSQLGSLKYTQAEANAIEEKFSAMLQVLDISLPTRIAACLAGKRAKFTFPSDG